MARKFKESALKRARGAKGAGAGAGGEGDGEVQSLRQEVELLRKELEQPPVEVVK
jgi:hypothetical protein